MYNWPFFLCRPTDWKDGSTPGEKAKTLGQEGRRLLQLVRTFRSYDSVPKLLLFLGEFFSVPHVTWETKQMFISPKLEGTKHKSNPVWHMVLASTALSERKGPHILLAGQEPWNG